MQRRYRYVQFGVISVGQHQVFALDAASFERGHPRIAAHAVFEVYHRLAGMQLRQIADQGIGVDGAARILATTGDAFAQQIAFANQRQVGLTIDKTVLGGADHQEAAVTRRVLQA
jgi:hypothetical protein